MNVIVNIIGSFILLGSVPTYAGDKIIGVLNFELTDETTMIDAQSNAQEKARTKSIKPLLKKALAKFNYKIKPIDDALQNKMNQGVSYIFLNPDVAVELGQKAGVDYLIVGRVHKPSYLFAYIIVRIIDVKQAKLIARHVVEAKGKMMQTTRKSIPSLARKIAQTLQTPLYY